MSAKDETKFNNMLLNLFSSLADILLNLVSSLADIVLNVGMGQQEDRIYKNYREIRKGWVNRRIEYIKPTEKSGRGGSTGGSNL
jgi:hypothetical protein